MDTSTLLEREVAKTQLGEFGLDPNLVLYVPLWKRDGSTFMSEDRYGHLATVTGALWRPDGRWFDGVDDRVSIADHSALNFGTSSFSIEFWYQRQAAFSGNTYPSLFGKKLTHFEIAGGGWLITRANDTALHLLIRGNSALGYGAILFPLDTWQHSVWVVSRVDDQITVTCYTNGEQYSTPTTETDAGSVDNTRPLAIYRCDPNYSASQLTTAGILGEVRLYNRVLSLAEIQHNYQITKWRYSG